MSKQLKLVMDIKKGKSFSNQRISCKSFRLLRILPSGFLDSFCQNGGDEKK